MNRGDYNSLASVSLGRGVVDVSWREGPGIQRLQWISTQGSNLLRQCEGNPLVDSGSIIAGGVLWPRY